MIRQKYFLLSAVPVLFFVFLFGATPVLAIEYGGVGGRPASPREDNPRTQSIYVHTIKPGAVIEEGVVVVNNTEEVKTIRVYPTDYIPASGGGFSCMQYLDKSKLVGTWIEMERTEVTLEPKTNETVLFTINVPENAPVGESNGCIAVEEIKPEDAEEKGLSLSFRSAMRVALTLPGDTNKRVDIVSFGVEKKENRNILLKAQVKNTGNVSADTDVTITTNDVFGRIIAKNGGNFSILRDQTNDFNFELDQPFWGGMFAARLTVAYDPSSTVEIGKISNEQKRVLTAQKITFFSPPKPLAAVIEILVLLLILFALTSSIRTKRRLSWIENNWGRYEVKDHDTIYGLAQSFGVSWKILVRANHLEPPYVLRPGMIMRAPLKTRRRDILAVVNKKVKNIPQKKKLPLEKSKTISKKDTKKK